MLIQPLLILSVLAIAALAFLRFRTDLIERLLIVLFSGCAILFIHFPAWTTWIANRIGVGRGADLLLYLLTVIVLFFFLLVYIRFLRQERGHTALIRYLAIQFASRPETRQAQNGEAARK